MDQTDDQRGRLTLVAGGGEGAGNAAGAPAAAAPLSLLELLDAESRYSPKGGDVDWLFFGSGSARLLSRLIAGRRAGPAFLSNLRPSPARAPAAGDLCPLTGRARLRWRLLAIRSGSCTLSSARCVRAE